MARKGTTLVEITVAAILASTIVGATLQYVSVLRDSRRAAEHRSVATQHASNIAERLSGWDYDQVDERRIEQLLETEYSDTRLPEGQIKVRVYKETDTEAKRIGIEVHWRDRAGQQVTPVRLTLWRHNVGR